MSIWFAEQLSFTRIVCVSMSKYTTHVSEKLLNYSNSLGYIRYLFFYWFFKQKGNWHEKVLILKVRSSIRYEYLNQPLIYNLSVPTKKFYILKKVLTKINKKDSRGSQPRNTRLPRLRRGIPPLMNSGSLMESGCWETLFGAYISVAARCRSR